MTKECIDSVISNTKDVSFEIILVDNASTDGSKAYFETDNRICYIYNDENLGFGKANNKGIEQAKGRNIFFLNSDTLLNNNVVHILSNFLDTHQDVAICGGNVYNAKGKPSHSFMRHYPSIYDELSEFTYKQLDFLIYGVDAEFNSTDYPIDVAYITGADMMIRHSVLNKYGAFNPIFFMYYEDAELCYRIKKIGYKIQSVPGAKITHFQGASATKSISVTEMRSKITYFRLTSNKSYAYAVFALWKVRLLVKLVLTYFVKHRRYQIHCENYKRLSLELSDLNNKLKNTNWRIQ